MALKRCFIEGLFHNLSNWLRIDIIFSTMVRIVRMYVSNFI